VKVKHFIRVNRCISAFAKIEESDSRSVASFLLRTATIDVHKPNLSALHAAAEVDQTNLKPVHSSRPVDQANLEAGGIVVFVRVFSFDGTGAVVDAHLCSDEGPFCVIHC